MTQGYAPVNGLRMYYEVHGTGRPLVLLHGGLLTIDLSFGAIWPELAGDRQVIATELQGHGRPLTSTGISTCATWPVTWPACSTTSASARPTSSASASVAGWPAAGTGSPGPGRPDHSGLHQLCQRRISRRDLGSGPRRHLHPDAHRRGLPGDEPAYARLAPDPGHFEAFAAKASQAAGNLKGWTAAELARVSAPTLLIFGDHDFIRLEHAVEMQGLIPGA